MDVVQPLDLRLQRSGIVNGLIPKLCARIKNHFTGTRGADGGICGFECLFRRPPALAATRQTKQQSTEKAQNRQFKQKCCFFFE